MRFLDKIKNYFRRREKKKRKIGLALGGGGARGLAHLGVLEVLNEYNFSPDLITGTSMGAIVGASYAQNQNVEKIIEKVEDYLEKNRTDQDYIMRKLGKSETGRFSKWSNSLTKYYKLMRSSDGIYVLEQRILKNLINELIDEGDIGETEKTFATVAVDLISGDNFVMDKGPIREAVLASASLPAIFPPVRKEDRVLVDGGVSCVVPVEQALQLGADIVVAVDVSKDLKREDAPSRGIDILLRTSSIARNQLKNKHLKKAFLKIKPDIDEFQWFEFDRYQEIKEKGYVSASEVMASSPLLDEESFKVPV